MSADALLIQRGKIVIYRVFDIADEIDLVAVERVLSQAQGEARVRITRQDRPAVLVRNAPVRLRLGEVDFLIADREFKAETFATILDYGVFSIAFHVPIPPGTEWRELISLGDRINRSGQGPREIDAVARHKCRELAEQLKSALKRPTHSETYEDYVITFVESAQGVQSAAELEARVDIPALLLAETKDRLADVNREGILAYRFQYASDDLAVIDWNSAFVYEPSGNMEIADVLEFALCHLLEVRYYDDLLDQRLTELYDAVEIKRASPWYGRFSTLAHEANSRYLEISELMERVDNSIKFVGDYYLAVIYRAAIRRFRVPEWQNSISRKMQSLARVSDLLRGEVNTYRSHLLEMIIILLILIELLAPLWK